MRARERRRDSIRAELGQLDALEQTAAVIDDVAVTVELRALCEEWRGLLREDAPTANRLIRQVLEDRLAVARTPEGIRVRGMARFGPLVANVMMRGAMVPPGCPDRTRTVDFVGIWRAAA